MRDPRRVPLESQNLQTGTVCVLQYSCTRPVYCPLPTVPAKCVPRFGGGPNCEEIFAIFGSPGGLLEDPQKLPKVSRFFGPGTDRVSTLSLLRRRRTCGRCVLRTLQELVPPERVLSHLRLCNTYATRERLREACTTRSAIASILHNRSTIASRAPKPDLHGRFTECISDLI